MHRNLENLKTLCFSLYYVFFFVFFFKPEFRDKEDNLAKISYQRRRQKDYNPDALVPELIFLKFHVSL